MTLAAANMRIKSLAARLDASRRNLHALVDEGEWTLQRGRQEQVFAGVGSLDVGHRAGFAQIRLPEQGRRGRAKQPAFFLVATPVVITVEKTAIFACRCFHERTRYQARVT